MEPDIGGPFATKCVNQIRVETGQRFRIHITSRHKNVLRLLVAMINVFLIVGLGSVIYVEKIDEGWGTVTAWWLAAAGGLIQLGLWLVDLFVADDGEPVTVCDRPLTQEEIKSAQSAAKLV